MSSFKCEKCETDILDSENGYISECKHYPLESKMKSDNKKHLALKIIKENLSLAKKCKGLSGIIMLEEQEKLIIQFMNLGYQRHEFFEMSRKVFNETTGKKLRMRLI